MKTATKREPTPPRKLTNSALNQEPPPKTHKQPPSDNDDGEASDLEGGNLPADQREWCCRGPNTTQPPEKTRNNRDRAPQTDTTENRNKSRSQPPCEEAPAMTIVPSSFAFTNTSIGKADMNHPKLEGTGNGEFQQRPTTKKN